MKKYFVFYWVDNLSNEKTNQENHLSLQHSSYNFLSPEQVLALSNYYDVMLTSPSQVIDGEQPVGDYCIFLDTKGRRFRQR